MGMAEDVQPGAALATAEGGLDRADPEGAIAEAARGARTGPLGCRTTCSGTLNFLDDGKRVEGAALVRRGASFSLAQSFESTGRRTAGGGGPTRCTRCSPPAWTPSSAGGVPARARRRRRRGLHAAAGLDPVGRPRAHLRPRPGLQRPPRLPGRHQRRGPGHRHRDRRGPDRRTWRAARRRTAPSAPTASCPTDSRSRSRTWRRRSPPRGLLRGSAAATCCWCGPGSSPGPGARDGVEYAGGAGARAVVHHRRVAARAARSPAIATDTWGFEVRPNEFDVAFQPLHQVSIPHIGLFIGEMWDLDALAADCAADGVCDFLLVAAPMPGHRRGRRPGQPHRHQVTRHPMTFQEFPMPAVNNVLIVGGGAAGTATAILLADAGVAVDLVEIKPEPSAVGSGITLQGNALRVLGQLGVWDEVRAAGYPFDSVGLRAPDPAGTLLAEIPDARTGGPGYPATVGMPRPDLARILLGRAAAAGAKLRFGTTFSSLAQQDPGGVDSGLLRRHFLAAMTCSSAPTASAPGPAGRSASSWRPGRSAWASGGRSAPARPASSAPTCITAGPLTSPATARPGEDSLYAYIVEAAQDRSALTPDEQLATMRELASAYHGPWDDIRATLDDPAGQLHLVRDPCPGCAVEPRPRGGDRRRRALLPADPGAGRRAGPRGRCRARRAAARADDAGPALWDSVPPPTRSTGPAPSSRRPTSSASG